MVLLLTVAANLLMVLATVAANVGRPDAVVVLTAYGFTMALYLALVVPAAFARRARLFAVLIGLHIAIYLVTAVGSAVAPHSLSTLAPDHPGASAL